MSPGPTIPAETIPESLRFTDLDLPESVIKGIRDAGFEVCTPIQTLSLPITLQGKDIAAQAQTGTGKTATFLITIFSRLLTDRRRKPAGPRALVIAPTRELALQICEEAKLLGAHTGLEVLAVFGGVDYQKQEKALRQGPDIVVATPGRLIDYLKQKVFRPGNIRIVVIDEADRLFDMGFLKDLRYLLRRLPAYNKRQSMLFSATLSYAVMELAYEHMNNAQEVFASPQKITVEEIDQVLFHVGNPVKFNLLLGILKREPWHRILIFCNTRTGVEMLARRLQGNGLPAVGITGTVHQKKRLKIMQRFKAGEVKILVATDVASRGIHVEDIDIVINYDIPQDPEDYVHRIGRTGRAGKTGRAITLACETYVYHLEAVESLIREKIKVLWAEEDWYEPDRSRPHKPRRRKARRPRRTGAGRVKKGKRTPLKAKGTQRTSPTPHHASAHR
ncbi:MAG: DEAD/DEAH box helicase [Deltaproteobacteria bacterium]|nr:DEAD/DEAH box helicase [Deltaproteobacteria bacterium]